MERTLVCASRIIFSGDDTERRRRHSCCFHLASARTVGRTRYLPATVGTKHAQWGEGRGAASSG